jgi:hypothetical protein
MKPLSQVLCLVGVFFLILSCSDNAVSPQDEIRAYINSGVDAAEGRDTDALAELMHGDYSDQKGYNQKQLTGLLRGYFFRHKNIHLFTKIDSIELLAENEAMVQMHVAMAGSAISDVDALSSLRARIYRFELQLIKQDEWLLRHALWGPASIGDFE